MLQLLAALLLLLPIDPPAHLAESEDMRGALRALAIDAEILDLREAGHVLTRPEDFGNDLALLRNRWSVLWDAPPLIDNERFPCRYTLTCQLALNRELHRHVDAQAHGDRRRLVLDELDQAYVQLDTLRDARCAYYYVTVRREALKRLCDQLGPEAYYAGRLPPCVPLHRLQRVD